jgi:hypothetical protein
VQELCFFNVIWLLKAIFHLSAYSVTVMMMSELTVLGVLATLRKATLSFVMSLSVCSSARVEQLSSTGMIFLKFDV